MGEFTGQRPETYKPAVGSGFEFVVELSNYTIILTQMADLVSVAGLSHVRGPARRRGDGWRK